MESALSELAEIWLESSERNAVTVAAQAIDRALAQDAVESGSEMSEGLRSLLAPPLKAIFCIREADRIVEVLRVKMV